MAAVLIEAHRFDEAAEVLTNAAKAADSYGFTEIADRIYELLDA